MFEQKNVVLDCFGVFGVFAFVLLEFFSYNDWLTKKYKKHVQWVSRRLLQPLRKLCHAFIVRVLVCLFLLKSDFGVVGYFIGAVVKGWKHFCVCFSLTFVSSMRPSSFQISQKCPSIIYSNKLFPHQSCY